MTAPRLPDVSGRVFTRRVERRIKYRSWGQFFGQTAVVCCIGTFVVPADPWWAQPGFGALAGFCTLGALNAWWRLTQQKEKRG